MTELPLVSCPRLTVVVIGRNEGARLKACLDSITAATWRMKHVQLIYVDSDSSDGSPLLAASAGARVLRVRPRRPCAAVGRNAGWQAADNCDFVLFLDGDTELQPGFIERALQAFADPRTAIVWGHRREARPGQSLYVRVLDLDWVYPPGESAFCGGDALVRRTVLTEVNGFNETLIAGEEPEMCQRIRALGYRIEHIDTPMTRHDLAIRSFRAYWRRAFRAGHAYAEVAALTRNRPNPLWQREARRNRWHGGLLLCLPAYLLTVASVLPASSAIAAAAAPALPAALLLARSLWRCRWKSGSWLDAGLYALHSHFQQIPILFGQLAQRRDARRGQQRALIEYKTDGKSAGAEFPKSSQS